MSLPSRSCALAALLLAAACAHPRATTRAAQPAAAPPQQITAFAPALAAIQGGEIDRLLAFRGESGDSKMGDFLRQLYVRYGDVERVDTLAIDNAGPVSRGAFLAEHEFGPFVWDIITDGVTYPLMRASNDLAPYLRITEPPAKAAVLSTVSLDKLNAGKATEVFPLLVCRCMTEAEFRKQVDTLVRHGGTETSRTLVRSETVPGLENRLAILHYLSDRGSVRLGFHFTLWKVGAEWRINSVNWSQDELLPAPLVHTTAEVRRQTSDAGAAPFAANQP